MNIKMLFNIVSSLILSDIAYIFGRLDTAFIILLIFIGIDYITGICKAIYSGKLNSKIGAQGIIKKIGYISIVILSSGMDIIMNTTAIRPLVIYFFIANEGISIMENWGSMGLPLPKKLIDALEALRETIKDEKEEKDETRS